MSSPRTSRTQPERSSRAASARDERSGLRAARSAGNGNSRAPTANTVEREDRLPKFAEDLAKLLHEKLSEHGRGDERLRPLLETFDRQVELENCLERKELRKSKRITQRLRNQIRRGAWTDACESAHKLLLIVRPFDTRAAHDMVEESRRCIKEMVDQGFQNFMVFFGPSGVGKSTTVMYLTGHRIGERHDTHRSAAPTSGARSKEFMVDGTPQSRTTHIRCVRIPEEHLPEEWTDTIIALDTPGIGTNPSVELDVATAVGIHEALKHYDISVWPVVVLSKEDVEDPKRSEGTLNVLAHMFSDTAIVQERVSFLLTGYKAADRTAFLSFEKLMEHLRPPSSKDGREHRVKAMQASVRKASRDQAVFPLKQERIATHLASILRKQPLHSGNFAGYLPLNPESRKLVQRQQELSKKQIEYALRQGHVKLVGQRLREMQLLADILPCGRETLKDAQERVLDFLSDGLVAGEDGCGCFKDRCDCVEHGRDYVKECKDASTDTVDYHILHSLSNIIIAELLQDQLPNLHLTVQKLHSARHAIRHVISKLKDDALDTSLPLSQRNNQLRKLRELCGLCKHTSSFDREAYGEATKTIAASFLGSQKQALGLLEKRALSEAAHALAMARHFDAHLTFTDVSSECTSSNPLSNESADAAQEQEEGSADQRLDFEAWRTAFTESLLSKIRMPVKDASRELVSLASSAVETRGKDVMDKLKAALDLLTEAQRELNISDVPEFGEALQELETEVANTCGEHLTRMWKAIEQQCEEEKIDQALVDLRPLVLHLLAFKDVMSVQVDKRFAEHGAHALKAVVAVVEKVADRPLKHLKDTVRNRQPCAEAVGLLAALQKAHSTDQQQPDNLKDKLDSIIANVKCQAREICRATTDNRALTRIADVVTDDGTPVDNFDALRDAASALDKLECLWGFDNELQKSFETARQHVKDIVKQVLDKANPIFHSIPSQAQPEDGEGNTQPPLDFTLELQRTANIETFKTACCEHDLARHIAEVNELEGLVQTSSVKYGDYVKNCFFRIHNQLERVVKDAVGMDSSATQELRSAIPSLQIRLDDCMQLQKACPPFFNRASKHFRQELYRLRQAAFDLKTKCRGSTQQHWQDAAVELHQKIDFLLKTHPSQSSR